MDVQEHGLDCVNPQPIYFCPTSMSWESPCHGGFDVCCSMPIMHIQRMPEEDLYRQLALNSRAGLRRAEIEGQGIALLEGCLEVLMGLSSIELPIATNLEIVRLVAKINDYMVEAT